MTANQRILLYFSLDTLHKRCNQVMLQFNEKYTYERNWKFHREHESCFTILIHVSQFLFRFFLSLAKLGPNSLN